MIYKRFLFGSFLGCLALIGFTISNSFFSDQAVSSANTFTASAEFPTQTPTPHVVINEVLYDLSENQRFGGDPFSGEFVEIYNPTAGTVNLTNWTLEDNSSPESLSGNLPSGGFLLLIATSSADFQTKWSPPGSPLYVEASGNEIGNGLANDGDKLILKNNGTTVDQMSWGNVLDGFTPACSGSCPDVATGRSLERSPDGFDTEAQGDFVDTDPPTPGS